MATNNVTPNIAPLPAHLAQQLCAPLPPEAITAHPSKSYLSSIKNIYAIERLNQVFGIGGWTFRADVIEHDKQMVVVKVTFLVEQYGILLEQFGGNDNEDRGDAFKGAVTDALSKISSYLGIGMEVYKGHGPTKQNPRNTTQRDATPRNAPRKPALVKPQPAVARIEELPDYEYEEAPEDPSEVEEQLAKSLAIADAFKGLKRRYEAIHALKTYYAVLGLYGKQHANFTDVREAHDCYKDMLADIRKREAGRQ
jgi:hypothetical protein